MHVCVCLREGCTWACTIETGDQPENGIVYGIEDCFQEELKCAAVDGPDSAATSTGKSEKPLWFE